MWHLKSYNKHIIKKLQSRVLSLSDDENMNFEINEIIRLLYILKHYRKRKPPVDGGGLLQMSLSL